MRYLIIEQSRIYVKLNPFVLVWIRIMFNGCFSSYSPPTFQDTDIDPQSWLTRDNTIIAAQPPAINMPELNRPQCPPACLPVRNLCAHGGLGLSAMQLAGPAKRSLPSLPVVEHGIDRLSIIKRFIVYQGIDCWGWHLPFIDYQTIYRLSRGPTVGNGIDRLSIMKRFIVYQGIECWLWHLPFIDYQTIYRLLTVGDGIIKRSTVEDEG